eukprot:jgi/Chlat1/4719/Chrsp30S04767
MAAAGAPDDEALLNEFMKEMREVDRENEVHRQVTDIVLSAFKLNPYEHLGLKFTATPDEIKQQYRKVSLMIHPDKCKAPGAKEAFAAVAKAQTELLDDALRAGSTDIATTLIGVSGVHVVLLTLQLQQTEAKEKWEQSDDFHEKWKLKARDILANTEWRRRKLTQRISEEEGRLKKEEEETREDWKRKREHEAAWENTRENRVGSWRDFMTKGSKTRKVVGQIKPPKLKTEDPDKRYIQRPVERK